MQNSLLFFSPPPPPPFPSLLSFFPPPPPPPSADNRRTRSRALKARRGNKPRAQKVRRNVRSQRTSVYRGVTKHKYTGKYEARLWDKDGFTANKKGRQYHLGGYDVEELAAQAYDLAAIKCWGNEAVLNFPASIYEREAILMQHFPKVEYLVSLRRRSAAFARGMSKYRGVTKHHHEGRWEARLGMVRGKKYIYLGSFDTQEKAAEAYDRAAVFHRGPNAITNYDISNYITPQQQQLPQYIPNPQPQHRRRLPLLLPRPFPLRPFPQLQYITIPQPPPMTPQPLSEPPTVDLPPPPPADSPNQEMDPLPEISWDLSCIDLNFEDFDIPDTSTSQPDGLSDDSGNASFDFDLDGIWRDQYVEESEMEVQLNRMGYGSVTETTTAAATSTAAVDGVAQEEAMDSVAFTTNTVTAAVDGLAQEEAMDSGVSTSERPEPFGFPFDEEYYSVCFSPLIGIF